MQVRRFFGQTSAGLLTHVGVLGETVTFVRYRFGHAPARHLGDYLRAGRALSLFPIELVDDVEGWRWFLRLSLVDCRSFALMTRLGLREAATFDRDFVVAGFTPVFGR